MAKKIIYKRIAYFLLITSILFFIYDMFFPSIGNNLGAIVLSLGVFASIISIESPTSYTRKFVKGDWKCGNEENEKTLYIPRSKHGMGRHPIIEAVMLNGREYSPVMCEVGYTFDGDVWLRVNDTGFEGYITIYE